MNEVIVGLLSTAVAPIRTVPPLFASSGLTPGDVLNSTTGFIVGIASIVASFALRYMDRRTQRKNFGTEWEKRADALTKQVNAGWVARLRDRDEQIRSLTAERDEWMGRWMGVPNDGSRTRGHQRPSGSGTQEGSGRPDGT